MSNVDTSTVAQALTAAAPGTIELGIGVVPPAGMPRPDMDGLRVRIPGTDAVYLIMHFGFRRWIPGPDTYERLFRGWDGILLDPQAALIPEMPPLSTDAVLARADDTSPVYLVSNGFRSLIMSAEARERYDFDYAKVRSVPAGVLNAVPEGPPINWPQQ